MKRKNSPSRLLDTRRHFDFVVPYTLDDSTRRLNNYRERMLGLFTSKKLLQIQLVHVKHDLVEFEMKRDHEAIIGYGVLKPTIANETHVSGYAEITSSALGVIFLLVVTHVFIAGFIMSIWWLAFLVLAELIVIARFMIRSRDRSIRLIEEALTTKQKIKRNKRSAKF